MQTKLKLFFVAISFSAFSSVLAMEDNEKKLREVATEALGKAIITGNVEGVRKALEQGADVTIPYTRMVQGLFGAVRETYFFIEHALIALSDDNALPILKLLFEYKADPNQVGTFGRFPLHWAVSRKRFKCQALLLEYDADMNAQANSGDTPLNEAVTVDYRYNKTCLTQLDTRSIQLLLNAGADPTVCNRYGFTSLHLAAYSGCPEFFEKLIRFVPIQDIVREKREAAVALLLCFKRCKTEYGVKVKIPKDIQRMLCNYCAPGIADVDVLVDKKIETLRKWLSLKGKDQTIRDIAENQKIPSLAHNVRYNKVQELTDLDELDKHKLVIRKSIKKLLQDTPLWGNVWSKQGVER